MSIEKKTSPLRWMAVFLCGTGACVPAPKPASVPVVPPAADARTREEFYESYKLTGKWQRRDGTYSWPALKPLAQRYPETKDIYDRANSRELVVSILAGLGGGIIGGTFGWNLAEKEENRMSGGTQIALYGIGGALAVSSLFAALTWHNPADDFADAYNRSLRIELGMPGGRAFDPLPPIDLRSLKPDAVMVMRDPWSTSR